MTAVHRWMASLLAASCMVVAGPSYALGWLDVVGIAQGLTVPAVNASSPGAAANPPPIDGASNMGGNTRAEASFTCPSAGNGILVAGASNILEEFEVAAGVCSCNVECCSPFGCITLPTGGIVTKFWENSHFVEVVRHRGCSPSLFGAGLGQIDLTARNAVSAGGEDGFYHVHAIPNPALAVVKASMEQACHIAAVADTTPYFSELDFIWNPANISPDLGSPTAWTEIAAPDIEYVAKKVLWSIDQVTGASVQSVESLACVGECVFITAGGAPMSALGNCSGCNGLVAPYNGKATGLGGRRAAELLAHRFVNLAMNKLLGGWSSTTSSAAYCNSGVPRPSPGFPKNEFRLQSLYPAEESSMRKFGAPHTLVAGEAGKQGDFFKQDYVFLLWKRRECCVSAKFCTAIPS